MSPMHAPHARSCPALVVVLRVEDPQNREEEVDDVEVQRDGRRNLLLHVVVAHDQLRVDLVAVSELSSTNEFSYWKDLPGYSR
jgi:hypothetical protein